MLGDNIQTLTRLHPVGLAVLAVLSLFVLYADRRWTVVAFIVMATLVPSAQRLVIGPMDFTLLRMLVVVGWMRLVLKREYRAISFGAADWAMVTWVAVGLVVYTIQQNSVSALINRLGFAMDALGTYFYIRASVRAISEVRSVVNSIAMIAVLLGFFFLVEVLTGVNPFGVMGGPVTTRVWDGSLRLQGAFSHPILAGAVAAALIPYTLHSLIQRNRPRTRGVVATASLIFVVFASNSSTSFMGVMAAFAFMLMYPFRFRMKKIRWTAVAGLIGLDIVMQARVWHLVSRIDLRGGSTGWHRYRLIDRTITNFHEWWLTGLTNIDHWNVWANDVTNQYVLMALRGGGFTLAAFIAMIAFVFRDIGAGLRVCEGNQDDTLLLWALGVGVAVHLVNFIGVSYFGQADFGWYLSLGLAVSAVSRVTEPQRVRQQLQLREASKLL